MQRNDATKFLRDRLDENDLTDWHIRLTIDVMRPYLGLCSYKDKTIILNAHHIDQHPEEEVKDTILHEVAHALCVGHDHDDVWKAKAINLGCNNPGPCSSYSLSPEAIDAIRSGADMKIEYEELIIKKPKITISRLQDKCVVCDKIARVRSRQEIVTKFGHKVMVWLECNHFYFQDISSTSSFETLTFDGDKSCNHTWGIGKEKTICSKCNAKRLYDFQLAGARALERANGRMGIFDEMGLGKTIQALAYLAFHEADAWPFLWITRSGIRFQHAKEIGRLLGIKAFPQVITTSRSGLIPGMNVIASYDIFRRMDLTKFKKHGFKTIILDECQAVKNPDSTRTQIIRQIAKDIPKIIPLSGTPWKNRGSEFFVALNMLDPKRFWSFEGFKRQWVRYYWHGNKQIEGGIADPIKFKEFIADLVIRREREEVLPELPTINRVRFMAEIPEFAKRVYKEEEDKLIAIFNEAVIGGDEESFDVQKQLMQSLIVMRQVIGIAKVPATCELAQEFLEDTDRKLVIFVHHKECGYQIHERMKTWCSENRVAQPLTLTAEMDGAARFEQQQKFNGPDYRLLIASTLASGEGLNLQSCSDCIMHERQWNAANEEQAEGRFIRIGQQATSITATYVHGDDTIDPALDSIVNRKRIEFHSAMNKGTLPVWEEQSVIKELIASIAAKRKGKK